MKVCSASSEVELGCGCKELPAALVSETASETVPTGSGEEPSGMVEDGMADAGTEPAVSLRLSIEGKRSAPGSGDPGYQDPPA
jgi:hypothetical protein